MNIGESTLFKEQEEEVYTLTKGAVMDMVLERYGIKHGLTYAILDHMVDDMMGELVRFGYAERREHGNTERG